MMMMAMAMPCSVADGSHCLRPNREAAGRPSRCFAAKLLGITRHVIVVSAAVISKQFRWKRKKVLDTTTNYCWILFTGIMWCLGNIVLSWA